MSPVDASASKMDVLRKSYNAVSRVCIISLVHALCKVRVSRVRRQPTKESTLSIVKVCSRTVESMKIWTRSKLGSCDGQPRLLRRHSFGVVRSASHLRTLWRSFAPSRSTHWSCVLGHILDVIKGDLLASAASLEKTRVSVAFRVIVAPCAHRWKGRIRPTQRAE